MTIAITSQSIALGKSGTVLASVKAFCRQSGFATLETHCTPKFQARIAQESHKHVQEGGNLLLTVDDQGTIGHAISI